MTIPVEELKALMPFATKAQARIAAARIEGKTWAWITENLGVEGGNARKTLQSMKRRAVNQGFSPEHDMTHSVPDGFRVKGVSTYYDADGNPRAQWVKSQTDQARVSRSGVVPPGQWIFRSSHRAKAQHGEADPEPEGLDSDISGVRVFDSPMLGI
jgi:hypothetical protein